MRKAWIIILQCSILCIGILNAIESQAIRFYGKGYLETKACGLKVLHVKGTAYERGFQHGMLLKEEIEEVLNSGVTMFALMLGGDEGYDAGLKKLIWAKDEMKPFIPPELRQEIQGLADALKAEGSNLTYDDIVLWNSVNDSYCYWAYGHHKESSTPGIRHPYPKYRGSGCSTVTAYGEATQDGVLIQGKNNDWYSSSEMRKNPILMVADPTDGGYGFLAPVYPGWIACIEGMNEKAMAIGLEISPSDNETMKGLGWHFLTRLLLQYTDSIDDAINILTVYPRACGNIHHVADAKVGYAAVIEHTANEIGVIYPEHGKNFLWSTNHFNGYSGFQGYKGINMVETQKKSLNLDDISTIEKWQASLTKNNLDSWGRYKRIGKLLNENFGRISAEKMIKIVSDRYDHEKKRVISWDEFGQTCIAWWEKEKLLSNNVRFFKSNKSGPSSYLGSTIWSLVSVPIKGDLYIAMADPVPAQKGPFMYINLLDELKRSK